MTDDMRKLIDEVERLDAAASAGPWHERDAETENGYSTSAVSLDSADDDGLSPADLLMLGRNIAVGLNMWDAALIADYRTAAPALAAEVERLDARLADIEEDARRVLADSCAPDERHCSCVPHLRARLVEVERERDETCAMRRAEVETVETQRDEARENNRQLRMDIEEARLTLAAEQGRQEGAPSEGWQWTGKVWFHAPTCMVVEPAGRLWRLNPDAGDPRHWRLSRLKPMPARAAMLAADAATG